MLGTKYDFIITRKERKYLTPRSSRGLLPVHMCKRHRHCSGEKRFIGSAVLTVALISSDHLIKVICWVQYVRIWDWEHQCRSANGRSFRQSSHIDRPQISKTSHLRNFAPHDSFDNSEFFILKSTYISEKSNGHPLSLGKLVIWVVSSWHIIICRQPVRPAVSKACLLLWLLRRERGKSSLRHVLPPELLCVWVDWEKN